MKMPQIHIGVGTQIGPLTVMPVWWAVDPHPELLTGERASVEVSESPDGPAVSRLVVSNRGSQPALLVDGELLEGGYQDRALVSDLVLAAGQTQTVPVVCVERGRWSGVQGHRRRVRRTSVGIRTDLREKYDGSRQSRVWSRVDGYDRRFGASATAALVDHLDAPAGRADSIDDSSRMNAAVDMLNQITALSGQQGYLVGIAGHPLVMEVFADPAALSEHLRPALVGVLLDAAAADAPWVVTPGRRARRFATHLATMYLTADANSNGTADAYTGGQQHLAATATVFRDHAVHLTAMRTDHALVIA